MWDAERYLQFTDNYSRPFLDLMARVPRDDFHTIVDLGCGPGDLTRALLDRCPSATVTGVDSSPEMLERARAGPASPRLHFVQGDIAAWQPDRPVDLLLSNAALQWVPDHAALLPRLVGILAPAGVLAVQMPDHFGMPVSQAIAEVVGRPRWRARLEGAGQDPATVQPLAWYARLLHDLGLTVDAWETTYVRLRGGENPVLEWMRATALRPFLGRLGPDETDDFLREVGERFLTYYPPSGGLTLVPSKRMFFIAARAARPAARRENE
jgi:trans-aconitate 2-methyltransferase